MNADTLFAILFDHLKKIMHPGEWIDIDMALSKSELFTLLLVDRQGELIMSQLADTLHIPMSTATGIVERLVKNGYLRRERSEADRRIVSILLTDKGKQMVERLKGMVNDFLQTALQGLTAEEQATLVRLAIKIFDAFDRSQPGDVIAAPPKLTKIDIE